MSDIQLTPADETEVTADSSVDDDDDDDDDVDDDDDDDDDTEWINSAAACDVTQLNSSSLLTTRQVCMYLLRTSAVSK